MSAGAHALRAYAPEDFAAVGAFWVEAWAPVYPEIDFSARLPWLRDHLAELAARGVDVVVALDARGAPCGLLTIDHRDGHLDQLCVAAGEQGGGLAAALLDEAKARAPGVVTLAVNDRNARAVRFYLREGFLKVGTGVSAAGNPTTAMRWAGASGRRPHL